MVESPEEEKKKKHQGEDLSTTIFLLPFPSLFGLEFNETYEIREAHTNISKNLEGYGVILYLTEFAA